jgi:hypothetical protein
MKIALDLDGTCWKHKEFFINLCKSMKNMGHSIGILTAHFEEECKNKDLDKWINDGFPQPDFYIGRKGDEHNMLIGEWKRNMLDKYKIDYLFDDFGGNNSDIINTFFEKDTDSTVFIVIPGEDKNAKV